MFKPTSTVNMDISPVAPYTCISEICLLEYPASVHLKFVYRCNNFISKPYIAEQWMEIKDDMFPSEWWG